MTRTRELTNSMRSCWNACHRKYKFSYVDQYKRNRTSDALIFGTAFHSMMEIYWGEMLKETDCEEAVLKVAEDFAFVNDDAFGAKTLLALFNGYVDKYIDNDMNDFACVSVESRFDTPLLNPENGNGVSKTFHLSGKIDGIIANKKTGAITILEHKTTSMDIDPTSDYWLKLPIDGQVSGYYLGAASLGYQAQSCLYDVIRKPTIKPYKATPIESRKYTKDGKLYASQREFDETADEWFDRLSADIAANPDKYFQRLEITRSETDLEDYLFDMWSLSKELIEAEKTGHFSRNPNSCSQYGTCEFFGVCTNCESLEDTILFTKKTKANEEL